MITPVNGHLLIDPVKHDSFVVSQRETFEEIGVVVALPSIFSELPKEDIPEVGDKVYFDSWLASKYPHSDGEGFFWLVPFEDVRAIEK